MKNYLALKYYSLKYSIEHFDNKLLITFNLIKSNIFNIISIYLQTYIYKYILICLTVYKIHNKDYNSGLVT